MFSVHGAMAVTRTGTSRAAQADRAASTAAAPLMSVFIVVMPSAVLSESPPESNVMPLPDDDDVRAPRRPAGGRYSAQTSRGGSVEPRATPSRPPRRSLSIRDSSHTSTVVSAQARQRRSTTRSASCGRREIARRGVDEVPGEADGLGGDRRRAGRPSRSGAAVRLVARRATSRSIPAGGARRLVDAEPVGGEHRTLGRARPRPRPRRRAAVGQHERADPGAHRRSGRRRPRARRQRSGSIALGRRARRATTLGPPGDDSSVAT